MKGIALTAVLLISTAALAQSSGRLTRQDYIDNYYQLAIDEMLRSGVPASIKLAQALLESDNGNSRLAVKGKNHFGIKCHSAWKGKKIYHDDDEKNECFRQYRDVYESFKDHSDFLTGSARYASLFELEITDYKGWAQGLKKAGYATSRKYADLLIEIIEDNNLQQYDLLALEMIDPEDIRKNKDNNLLSSAQRKVMMNNRVDYIITKPGDSFSSLNEELNLMDYELFRYNELTADSSLRPGQVLYLQPKRNKAERGNDFHILKEGETLYDVSQVYGVKLEKLRAKNNLKAGEEPEPGTRISLRKSKGVFIERVLEKEEPSGDGDKLKFEFQD